MSNETEEIRYVNYGSIDQCDLCGNDIPILNYNDEANYLTFTGKHLYCKECNDTKTNLRNARN